MRTIPSNIEAAWRRGVGSVWCRVTIGGVEITNLEDHDWLRKVTINQDVDQPMDTAQVEVAREFARLSLATFVDKSKLNQSGTVVDVGKDIQIETAVIHTGGQAPKSEDIVLLFDGFIDEVDWSKNPIKLKCRDLGALLGDLLIETINVYGSDAGRDLEDVIQDILDDHVNTPGYGSVTLYSINGTAGTPFQPGDSPGWKLHKFYQSKTRVLEGIRALATMIGWDVRYRYNTSTSGFELTLYEPDRSKTTPNFTFASSDEYKEFSQLAVSRLDVRNAVKIVYTDFGTVVMSGTPNISFWVAGLTGGPNLTFTAGSPATITRSAGSWITDNFVTNDQEILVSGSASNDGRYIAVSRTATVLTLKAGETLVNEGPVGGVSIDAEDIILRASGNFQTDGFVVGHRISVLGSTNNDGEYQISTYVGVQGLRIPIGVNLTAEGPVGGVSIATGLRTTIAVEDTASIAKYGRKSIELTESSSSQIDTIAEAYSFANACLSDLAEPTAVAALLVPFFPWVELVDGDLWQIPANGVHFDTDQNLAPQKVTHTLSASGDAKTVAVLRGKISGGRYRWLDREGLAGVAAPIDDKSDDAPAGTAESAGVASIVVSFDDPRVASPRMPDWDYTEVHLNTSTPYTPSEATLVARIQTTRVEIGSLVPGQTYYIILIHYDSQGNASTPTSIITQATQKVGPYHTNNETEIGTLNRNSSFGVYTFPEATNPPDFWEPKSPTVWANTSGNWFWANTPTYTGDRVLKFNNVVLPVTPTFDVSNFFWSDYFLVETGKLYQAAYAFRHNGDSGGTYMNPIIYYFVYDSAKSYLTEGITSESFYGWENNGGGGASYAANTWFPDKSYFRVQSATAKYARIAVRIRYDQTFPTAQHPTTYCDRVDVSRAMCKLEYLGGAGNRAVPVNTWTAPWLTLPASFDNANGFTPGIVGISSGAYTVPVDGEYTIHGQIQYTAALAANVRQIARLMVNAAPTIVGPNSAGGPGTSSIASFSVTDLRLSAGDIVNMEVLHSAGGGQTILDSGCKLTISQITDTGNT